MEKLIIKNSKGAEIIITNSVPFVLAKFEVGNSVNNVFTSSTGQDGSTYVNNVLNMKDIVIDLTLTADTEAELEQLKKQMCTVLNPKLGELELTYVDDFKTRKIKCVLGDLAIPDFNQSKMFSRCTINLIAHNPYWQDTEDIKEDIVSWTNLFEFPIEVPVEGLEFATRNQDLIVNVINSGDVSTGMIIVFKANASVVNPGIIDVNTQKFIKLKYTMSAGEEIRINTNFNNKRIESTLNKVTTNIFKNLDWESTFLQLDVGDNLFRYNAESGLTNLDVSIYHNNSYLGV